MSKTTKTFLIGRDAQSGVLTTVEYARENSATCIVERMPKKGHGDTEKK